MPLYEYECTQCGSVFEVLQHFGDPLLTKCRQCGGRLEKKVSAPAIKFKGSGWYVTDYAHKTPNGNGAKPKAVSKPEKTETAPKKDDAPKANSSPASGDQPA